MRQFLQFPFISLIFMGFLFLDGGTVLAQEMKAFPAPAVEKLPIAPLANPGDKDGLVFLELYAAENCAFCPAAERNFSDIVAGENVIGITCMVGYFDSGTLSALSRPFCKDQQNIYARMMGVGSLYTPQLIINGTVQVQGHNLQKISEAIQQSRMLPDRPLALTMQAGAMPGEFDVILPPLHPQDMVVGEKFILRILMIRRDPDLSLLNGTGQKRDRAPQNIATDLIEGGFWDGRRTIWPVKPPADGISDAFIVLVQDRDNGHILAAGQQELARNDN